jgi:hypothetical protein
LVTVLVIVWPEVPGSTVAVIVSVAAAPSANVPTVHVGVAQLVPADGVTVPTVRPAGSASSRLTPVASAGPLLVTVNV